MENCFPSTDLLAQPKYALENICLACHNISMAWKVEFDEAFAAEFDDLPEAVQDELLAHARLLESVGPHL